MISNYSISLKGKSLFAVISEADIVVQVVVFILLLASIWSWTIILNKIFQLRSIKKRNKKFFKLFDSKSSFGDIFESIKNNVVSPIEYIFTSTIDDIKHYKPEETGQLSVDRRADMKARLKSTMVHSKNKHINKLENDLEYLATIASVSPFIGLFGTVWGIMQSFQAIAFSKNTSLAIVAPGIAEALFATALGLVAAIPALMFYNILVKKIVELETVTDDFLVRFNNKIETILKL